MIAVHGDEPFYIDQVCDYVEAHVLTEDQKAFNQLIIYGKDADARTIIDSAKRYPIMAERQLIVLKEAQDMKGLEELLGYVEQPVPSTLLVIAHKYKKIDGRGKLSKALDKSGWLAESKKLYDNQIPDWIKGTVKSKGFGISPDACVMLAEYLGNDLSKISNELDKLELNLAKGAEINLDLIQQFVGISKEYNVFEFQKALGEKRFDKAMRIAFYFAENPKKHPLVMTLGALYNYFSKVYMAQALKHVTDKELAVALKLGSEFFAKEYRQVVKLYQHEEVRKVFSLLKEYDLMSKGVGNVNVDDGELLKELVVKMRFL